MRIAGAGFLILAAVVWSAAGWVASLNQRIADAMQSPFTTSLARVLTHAGDPPVLTTLLLIASVLLWRWGKREQVRLIVGSVLAAALLRWALLPVIASARPDVPYAAGLGFSFPSGHAVYTASAAITLFYLSLPYAVTRTKWTLLVLFTCAWPAVVGATRIILGAHWPTDVIGGLLLAMAVLPLVARLARTDHTLRS